MPIELPNLDDRTYDDLVQEALSSIPAYAPDWTNYNPSDPGIALIELFAYLTEMQIYRLNRVTDANQYAFLKLLNGADWQPSPQKTLNEEIGETVRKLWKPERAVTCEDYERLSTENFNDWLVETGQLQAVGRIQRAYCVAERNLAANIEEERRKNAPGHISVVILPPFKSDFKFEDLDDLTKLEIQPSEEQRQVLWKYLDDRRLLTTRHHVVGPTYVPISAEILVARQPDAVDKDLYKEILNKIARFFSPLPDPKTSNKQEWTFGRDIYVSELYKLLEQIEGIDYLPDILLTSQCPPQSDRCVAAQPIWNDEGDQIGLQLYNHHLPAPRLNRQNIVIAANENFRAASLKIAVTPTANTNIADLKQRIQAAVREFFKTLRRQPDPNNPNPTRIQVVTSGNNKIIRQTRLEVISRNPIQYRDLGFQDLNLNQIAGIQTVTSIDLGKTEIVIEPQQVIDLSQQVRVEGGENDEN